MTAGEKLVRYRKMRGLTQTELAEKMGYKTNTIISAYETGRRRIGDSTRRKFAEALEVSMFDLMDDDDTTTSSIFKGNHFDTSMYDLAWVKTNGSYANPTPQDKKTLNAAQRLITAFNQIDRSEEKQELARVAEHIADNTLDMRILSQITKLLDENVVNSSQLRRLIGSIDNQDSAKVILMFVDSLSRSKRTSRK